MNISEMTLEELRQQKDEIEAEIAKRLSKEADDVHASNERLRKAREIMRQANCTGIKPWARPGDRRVYLSWDYQGRMAFGEKIGSAKYPIIAELYLDGSSRFPAGWHVEPARIQGNVEKLVGDILAALEMSVEQFVATGKALYV